MSNPRNPLSTAAAAFFLFGFVIATASAQLGPGKLLAKRVVTGLSRPVWVTSPPGDNDRIFIVEKIFDLGGTDTGRIRIFDKTTSTLLGTPFFTFPGVNTGNEEGLLGLAFHPDYNSNGYFYVYFSDDIGGRVSRILRFTANAPFATATTTAAGSGVNVLAFSQPQSNHNGGWIGFNPTATGAARYYLYISTGDGGGADDDDAGHTAGIGNGQDKTNLLGKILRLDTGANGDADDFPAELGRNYAIPPSNPLVGDGGGVREEIWSYGLRNPWRCCFDRVTGDFWIGDVGQNNREEIDFQPASQFITPPADPPNYGWRLREGDIATPTPAASPVGGPPPAGHVPPVIAYPHGAVPVVPTDNGGAFRGFSVTGGCVYRGTMLWLQGAYIFSDYGSNRFWTIRYNGASITQSIEWNTLFGNLAVEPPGTPFTNFASISEGGDGEIYVCTQPDNGASETAGTVFLLTQKPFFRYRSKHFTLAELNNDTISGVNADFDNDDMTTAEEFALNTNPKFSDRNEGTISYEGANPPSFLTLILELSAEAKEAVTYSGQSGGNLQDFSGATATAGFDPPTGTTLKIRDTVPVESASPLGDRRFLRMLFNIPASELLP